MASRLRSAVPWTLVGASVLLVGVVLYLLFAAYLPARQQVARLERELHGAYLRDTQHQIRLQREQQQGVARERQLSAERDALAKRVEELESELATIKNRRKR